MINPDQLKYFIEISKTKNLSRAAERLGISQPSLTLAIQRIEHSLGQKVLFRSQKGVRLTPAGENLLQSALRLLDLWKMIQNSSSESMNQIEGKYTLGCHVSLSLYTLHHFLPHIIEEFPKLELQLKHELSRKITEEVVTSRIDFGLVVNPVRHPELIIRNIFKDKITLFQKKNFKKSSEIVSIFCHTDILQTQYILKKMKKEALASLRVVNSSSFEVISQLVKVGAGYGILPTRVAELCNGELQAVAGAPRFDDEICLIYRVENKKIATFHQISDFICAKLKNI